MNCLHLPIATLALASSFAATTRAQDPHVTDIFPYKHTTDDFQNGLRLITVPTEFPEVVCVYIVVHTGSRNEIEPGRSGFAHFFEHMMFRGTKTRTAAEQAALFKKAGAARNAYTTDDYTCYHTTIAKEDLDTVLMLEADRFQNLAYPEKAFRTEAMAVLGEYNKNSANPVRKIFEVLRDTSFQTHTYKHTTMGFIKDIVAMPKMYDYSLEFFGRWYKPQNCTIVIVGDVTQPRAKELVTKHFGGWARGDFKVEIPREPAQDKPLTCHVPWPAPTQPWVFVAFKGPGFAPEQKDAPALDVLASLYFSENSDLYQKLYVREQKVDVLSASFDDHIDPYVVGVGARARDVKDLWYVRDEILATFARAGAETVPASKLAEVKANMKYSFVARLDSSEGIASALAGYVARGRSIDTVNTLFKTYDQVTAADVQAMAKKYFVTTGRTIATCAHGDLPKEVDSAVKAGKEVPLAQVAAGGDEIDGKGTVLFPGPSPLVSVRLLYRAGAIEDPKGKEGLTYVTARLLANGSTSKRSYEDIVKAMFPMAAGVGFQVDKEMTVFSGTVHRDNLDAWYGLFREMLREPGWKQEDLDRVKADTLSALDVELRRSNDEELGKEVMYGEIYAGHPYRHHNAGTIESVKGITMDDVKARHQQLIAGRCSRIIGVAGGYPAAFPDRVAGDFRSVVPFLTIGKTNLPTAGTDIDRNRLTIVKKQALATGIHIGFPIEVTRAHPDWTALWLARSWLGEHRSENSFLYQRLREVRGLNYGDYAYIEYFPRGMFQFTPEPNHARTSQIFQIWIRPVPPQNGPFALKAAWYELDKLVKNGLTKEAFEATRDYLGKSVNNLVKTADDRLGYGLDSRFYGTDEFVPFVKKELGKLTVEQVNAAIQKHFRSDRLQLVVVAEDADGFRDAILSDKPTPITYQTKPSDDVLAEDKVIEAIRIPLDPKDVRIVPVEEVFVR